MSLVPHPKPLLRIRVHDLALYPSLTAMCAGYEAGHWRCQHLAEHSMEWLPEFALKYSEFENLGSANAVRLIKKAAKSIYKTKKFKRRGEFGELLLHIMIRHAFNTIPAICKIHYKDSRNDTVKGFDCVHVVASEDEGLELWLGEVKFYKKISAAIAEVVNELEQHTGYDYLRDEFAAITNKIDGEWPYAEKLANLLDPNTSLDEVFDVVCIPVLLTYDSRVISNHDRIDGEFAKAFEKEVRKHHHTFSNKKLPDNFLIRLFLLPLESKEELQKALNNELRKWH